MTESRNHHYIPQGYLRGFGWKRGKHYMVVVHDFREKKTYETNTRNVCAERDFMRFEAENRKPDFLEEEFSKLESKAVEAIRDVVKAGVFDGENKDYILNLMALLAVRSPEQRENMRDFQARVAQQIMDLMLEDKERWERETKRMEEATGTSHDVTYEEAKEFHERGEYTIEVARERHIATEIDLYHTVLQLLAQRRWTLYVVPGDYGEFVTTDRPVVIAYIEPEKVPPFMRHSPGFGLENTEVYFPLTKHALLIGRWDCEEGTVSPANQPFVGIMNKQMIEQFVWPRAVVRPARSVPRPAVAPPVGRQGDRTIHDPADEGRSSAIRGRTSGRERLGGRLDIPVPQSSLAGRGLLWVESRRRATGVFLGSPVCGKPWNVIRAAHLRASLCCLLIRRLRKDRRIDTPVLKRCYRPGADIETGGLMHLRSTSAPGQK